MDEDPKQKLTWKWNKAKLEAAQLLAVDELTDQEIAGKVDVRRQTLWGWKKIPEFAARVKEITEELGDVALRYAIGRRSRRVAALNDRWERMKRVIAERSLALDMQVVAGGSTGLMVRTMKGVGQGAAAQIVEEFEVDTGLLRELRELEKQAAIECGQWTEKREHSASELDKLIASELARLAGSGQATASGTPAPDSDAGAAAEAVD